MCWLYGNVEPCTVCARLATKPIDTKSRDLPLFKGYCTAVKLPETARLSKNYYLRKKIFSQTGKEETKKATKKTKSYRTSSLSLWDTLKRRKTANDAIEEADRVVLQNNIDTTMPLGIMRLFKFLAVLDFLGTAHWANVKFGENELMLRRLVATHLILIVGREEYEANKLELLSIIDAKMDLSKLVHIVWVTNRYEVTKPAQRVTVYSPTSICRQNGKTTTLARFLAAMAIMSPIGGPLIYVYSTTRDRAIELIDGAKRYIDDIRDKPERKLKLASFGVKLGIYEKNNSIGFSIRSALNPTAVNTIKARPKTADSCRGDAPRACMFDEASRVGRE